ncbi:MAG: gamma-glutamyl-gamma-aminobutyrate hydrolase family protein [Candidatus Hydrogenedentes bacterium]|nr:gamma-glutamyl-gamma-aminobutyrate hydrolase family protein [Candidatus Hydrogenedentota bacterium]
MTPLIGITSEVLLDTRMGRPWNAHRLLEAYSSALSLVGGAPVILPAANPKSCRATLEHLDGLILSGGKEDVPPEVFGEGPHPTVTPMPRARWDSEALWLATALELNKPVLGVCLGMQVMNVTAGGKLIQDIPDQCPGSQVHGDPSGMRQHEVLIEPDTLLARLAPERKVTITSSHHQAIKGVPTGFRIAALSEDGIIEAIEAVGRDFLVGVQWHPERNLKQPDWLLRSFVEHCANKTAS